MPPQVLHFLIRFFGRILIAVVGARIARNLAIALHDVRDEILMLISLVSGYVISAAVMLVRSDETGRDFFSAIEWYDGVIMFGASMCVLIVLLRNEARGRPKTRSMLHDWCTENGYQHEVISQGRFEVYRKDDRKISILRVPSRKYFEITRTKGGEEMERWFIMFDETAKS